jgi:hypothetical protein
VIEGTSFDACEREVTRPYGLAPVLSTHYRTQAAISQKVHALEGRSEPQARDVFDLALLIARPEVTSMTFGDEVRAWAGAAAARAAGISYDEYAAKVLAYLEPDHVAAYEDRAHWDALLEQVVFFLEALS